MSQVIVNVFLIFIVSFIFVTVLRAIKKKRLPSKPTYTLFDEIMSGEVRSNKSSQHKHED